MFENPLDWKKVKPVHLKGNQPWIFTERADAIVEAPILWPPDVKNWLIGKDFDSGKIEGRRRRGQQRMRRLDGITNSWSLLKLMSIESVMPSNHLILFHPLLLLPSIFPELGSFPMSQFFALSGQSIGASASASVLSMNIQDWFPLGLTGLISLQSKGLSRVFSK